MPLEEQQQRLFESKSTLSSSMAGVESINDRSQLYAGAFDKTNVTTSSSTNHTEPCNSSVARSDIGSGSAVACSNCGVTATPLWRRAPTGEIICNACGLYLKARNATRPFWLKRNTFARKNVNASKLQHRFVLQDQSGSKTLRDKPDDGGIPPTSPPISDSASSHEDNTQDRPQMVCANCSTTTTPLWRRDEEGNTICNACGLYYKLHNVQRPVTMKRSVIKRRKRVHANIISHLHPVPQPIQQRRLCPKHDHHHCSSDEQTTPILTQDSSSGGEASTDDEGSDRKRRYYEDGFHSVKRMNHGYPSPPSHYVSQKRPETMEPSAGLNYGPSHISSLLNPVIQEQTVQRKSQSTATAAAIATVSALLNPHSDVQHTQKVLEAHRQELRREVQHLTSLLSKTNAVLDNLDHAMVHAGVPPSPPPPGASSVTRTLSATSAVSILGNLLGGGDPNATNALATILTLGAAAAAAQNENSRNIQLAPLKGSPAPACVRELPPTPPPCSILPYPIDHRQSASPDSR